MVVVLAPWWMGQTERTSFLTQGELAAGGDVQGDLLGPWTSSQSVLTPLPTPLAVPLTTPRKILRLRLPLLAGKVSKGGAGGLGSRALKLPGSNHDVQLEDFFSASAQASR